MDKEKLMVGLRQYNDKWDVIRRKGRSKLSGMCLVYIKPRAQTLDILAQSGEIHGGA
jgi:hypothetical protein